MSYEIPSSEVRTFQHIGYIRFQDLLIPEEGAWIVRSIKEKMLNLPSHSQSRLYVSDTPLLKKILKKRGVGHLAGALLHSQRVHLQSHQYFEKWEDIEKLEKRPIYTDEELEKKELYEPRTPRNCLLALSLDHLWGCFFKRYAPSANELQLPTAGPFYLLKLTSHPQDIQRAPVING